MSTTDNQPREATSLRSAATVTEELARENLLYRKRAQQFADNLATGAFGVIGAGVLVPLVDVTYQDTELMQQVGRAGILALGLWLLVGMGLYWAASVALGDTE